MLLEEIIRESLQIFTLLADHCEKSKVRAREADMRKELRSLSNIDCGINRNLQASLQLRQCSRTVKCAWEGEIFINKKSEREETIGSD